MGQFSKKFFQNFFEKDLSERLLKMRYRSNSCDFETQRDSNPGCCSEGVLAADQTTTFTLSNYFYQPGPKLIQRIIKLISVGCI